MESFCVKIYLKSAKILVLFLNYSPPYRSNFLGQPHPFSVHVVYAWTCTTIYQYIVHTFSVHVAYTWTCTTIYISVHITYILSTCSLCLDILNNINQHIVSDWNKGRFMSNWSKGRFMSNKSKRRFMFDWSKRRFMSDWTKGRFMSDWNKDRFMSDWSKGRFMSDWSENTWPPKIQSFCWK